MDIYGTLGPACRQQETLEKMFACGMTGMRLNLSHTGLDRCGEWLESFRGAARRTGTEPKLLIDLQGPELRTGTMNPRELMAGETVELTADGAGRLEAPENAGGADGFGVPGKAYGTAAAGVPGKAGEAAAAGVPGRILVPRMVLEALKPGQQILLDDGKLLLEVLAEQPGAERAGKDVARGSAVPCRVLRGGLLKARKSIALPGVALHPPTLTESDLANLRLAKEYGVTGVMLPFVREAEDLQALFRALEETGGEDIRIFAKIENLEGVRKLPELLPYADEIVIARGDLGNAMPLWKLPAVQYEIANQCREAGKPYMVVTQMLASMEHAAVPTRAEVSDIFYAVLHGAASVMLTGETAAGEYPVEAMNYMCRTVEEALRVRRQIKAFGGGYGESDHHMWPAGGGENKIAVRQ